MKRNKLFIFVFVFIMFFGINIDGVLAKYDKGGGGNGTPYSYGIKCFYEGQLTGTANYGGSSGNTCGSDNSTKTPFVYGINFYCNNGSMSSDGRTVTSCQNFGSWGHGRAAHINGSDYKVVGITNYNDVFNTNSAPESTISYFGAVKNKGIKKCPSSIYVSGDLTISASQLMGDGEYPLGRLSFGAKGTKLKLLSSKTSRYSKGNGGNLEQDVKDVISEYTEITKCGDEYYDTTHGSIGDKITDTKNQRLVDAIKKWAEDKKNSQKNADIDIDANDELNCSQVLGDSFVEVLSSALLLICISGVVILIFMMASDFIKSITSGEADAMAEAFKKSKTRIIATIILLLLPILVNFIINILNNNFRIEEGNIKIGDISECNISKAE